MNGAISRPALVIDNSSGQCVKPRDLLLTEKCLMKCPSDNFDYDSCLFCSNIFAIKVESFTLTTGACYSKADYEEHGSTICRRRTNSIFTGIY
ncbi:unnamed protein product [Rhodiola kirilowii]